MKIALLYGGEIRADHSAKNAKAIYDDYAKSSPSCKVNMCKVDTDGYVYEEKIKSDIHRVLAFSDILIDTTYSYPKRAYHHSLAKKLNLKVFFAQEIDSHNHAKILEQVGISVNRHYLIKKRR